ncbi:MAG TPA: fumarylacetoacetate hydrolase family protein [Solirubrobacteraceae bacterium]|nr:fumarylacetoacetate hydrolase family protein [Solirubrobacteraceae bacterium]
MSPPAPSKIIAVHINFRGRAAQRGRLPAVPSYFQKPVSSIGRSGDSIVRPQGTEMLGVEGEIAVIVGSRARNITPEQGAGHVGWFAPANDVSLADMRWADRGSNLMAKGQDGYTPLGTPVEAATLQGRPLTIRTRVNGEIVQEDSSDNLIFDFGFLIADLSRFVTLEPGDVILTGTPAGAPVVQPGDEVEVELDGAGSVISHIAESPEPLGAFGAQPRLTVAARAQALGLAEHRSIELSADAREALRRVATATLTYVLARHGISNPVIAGVRPTRPGTRLLGYAFTLRYVPLREDIRDAGPKPNAQRQAVDSVRADDVLVIDARGERGAGTIGDIMATRVMTRGGAGVVTDGGLRDSATVAGLELPVYRCVDHPAALGGVHFPLESNTPIACGGALVMPGDVIVGDDDGVVVLPAALAEEVAAEALAQESREAWALERIHAGESLEDVYPLPPGRAAEYETWAKELEH